MLTWLNDIETGGNINVKLVRYFRESEDLQIS
jgi:hypothetical protein